MTALLRYKINDKFSVHGGARYITSSGDVTMANGYTMSTSDEGAWGYVLGAAYEIPEIALRAALTYSSEVTHEFSIEEYHSSFGTIEGDMDVTLPQSVNFNFQTGVAKDTLLMFNMRWADWEVFDISPEGYKALSGGHSLASFSQSRYTYSLGLGYRFNDKFSGSVSVGYEAAQGGYASNLGPTDGKVSLSLGGKYNITENTAISGGVSYVWIGDAETQNPSARGTTLGEFNDNHAVGVGLKISHSF